MSWTAQAVPWLIVAAALFILAAIIFSRQRASRVAVLFCAMIVLVAVWFAFFGVMFLATDPDVALRFGRLGLAGVALMPAAIYDFTTTALRLYSKRRRVVHVVWVVAGMWAVSAALTSGLAAGVARHDWGFYPTAGPLLPIFLLFFFAALGAQLVEGITEYRRTHDPKRKSRIARMLIAFVVVYVAAIDFLPMFGVPLRPLGYVAVLAFIAVAWTSILRHRLAPITAARAAREILETMADALFVLDAEGNVRVINGAARTLLGYSNADLLGRSIDKLEVLNSDATISRTLRELSRKGPIRDQHRLLRHKDGHAVDVSISISPVSEVNVQEGAVVIARDIRERMLAQEDLHSAMRRLEASNRELEDFAYVASHDLQEPLRKIQAFGDRLKAKHAGELVPQARDYIDRMQAAAKRMQILINDLLTFSRVTTKAQPFVPVDLGQIAREVAHDLELRAHDAAGEISIGALPSIDADPLQMRQLLQNLVSNALKFHREGVPPRVDISGESDNGRVRVVVRDNGIGFEEKYAERIFTMFERLHGRGSYEGTGIGLAICRKIAERHGGEIAARSTPGQGSTFIVTLPVNHEEGVRS
jgi:PAS domain S-box-containing protein